MTDNYPDEYKRLRKRWGALKTERASWIPQWKDLSDNILPRSGRFFMQDRNRGERKHNKIYDSTATRAVKVLAAGMMGGLTSPARPWFRLATVDQDLMKSAAVKQWLDDCVRVMLSVFARSNAYRVLHTSYKSLGTFGTAAAYVDDSFKDIVHLFPLVTGSYALAQNWDGDVDTMFREFEMPVHAVVRRWGLENVSPKTRNLYTNGSLDVWVPVMQAIEPRDERDSSRADGKNMPWRSVYFEPDCQEHMLSEGGLKHFRVLAPRWEVEGEDVYGESPAMVALGDIRALQHEQLRKAQGIDYKTNPPLQVPSALKNRDADFLPGGKSYYDQTGPHAGVRTAYEVNIDLNDLREDIADVRERINASFYVDMFLMLANSNNPQMTATEVAERHEEKMLMLGPVLERLQNELLDPLIDIVFDRVMAAGVLPPPPPELQNNNINVELVGILAQAQRAIGINAMDRFIGAMGAIAQAKPEVLDRLDADAWVDEYTDMAGVTPRILVKREVADQVRAERAKQQAVAAQAQMAQMHSETTRNLAQSDTSGNNALTDVTRQFAGYN